MKERNEQNKFTSMPRMRNRKYKYFQSMKDKGGGIEIYIRFVVVMTQINSKNGWLRVKERKRIVK